jgi:hypothetical protein
VTVASKAYLTADLFKKTRRSNGGSAMSDTFPASTAAGMVNGTRIVVSDADTTASITITAGAGTSMPSGSTDVVGPDRDVAYEYDATNATWRGAYNTRAAVITSVAPTAHAIIVAEGAQLANTVLGSTAGCLFQGQGSGSDPACNPMSGDVSVSSSGAATIQPNAVTYAKEAQSGANTLSGNPTGSTANRQDIPLPSGGCNGATSAMTWTPGSPGALGCNNSLGSTPAGMVNLFRNGTFDVWQRGTGATSIATSGAYFADGWWVQPTGAAVSCSQVSDPTSSPLALFALKCAGAASVTDISIDHPIESYLAAKVKGRTFTVQFEFFNNSGVSVTPKLTTRYPSAQDSYTSNTVDINAVSFQACANATVCLESLTETASASATNGYEVDIDFGNNWGSSSGTFDVSEADFRLTPGVTTGLNSAPPLPDMRPIFAELPFNQRYFIAPAVTVGVAQYSSASGQIADVNWTAPQSMRTASATVTASWGGLSGATAGAITLKSDARTVTSLMTSTGTFQYSGNLVISSISAEIAP